ncbi:hypothetical protein D9758_011048 [Tetrapyrgos nigripes]|uniref:Uncharacterized protein n=1 Tax=Tetrapyrgos nigripes TaxID=182062 RepID=A0A8H5CSH1_9AGAR|nr:hypothetical protein D9758_011048 [Tetrapyrgos nigripes]
MNQRAPPSLTSPIPSQTSDYFLKVAHYCQRRQAATQPKVAMRDLCHRTKLSRFGRRQHPYTKKSKTKRILVVDDRGFSDAVAELQRQRPPEPYPEFWVFMVAIITLRLVQVIVISIAFFRGVLGGHNADESQQL